MLPTYTAERARTILDKYHGHPVETWNVDGHLVQLIAFTTPPDQPRPLHLPPGVQFAYLDDPTDQAAIKAAKHALAAATTDGYTEHTYLFRPDQPSTPHDMWYLTANGAIGQRCRRRNPATPDQPAQPGQYVGYLAATPDAQPYGVYPQRVHKPAFRQPLAAYFYQGITGLSRFTTPATPVGLLVDGTLVTGFASRLDAMIAAPEVAATHAAPIERDPASLQQALHTQIDATMRAIEQANQAITHLHQAAAAFAASQPDQANTSGYMDSAITTPEATHPHPRPVDAILTQRIGDHPIPALRVWFAHIETDYA